VTEKVEGSRFPQTTSIYRCTNEECQNRKDKETEKRMKLQETKTQAEEKRAEEKVRQKKNLIAIVREHVDIDA
jgi:aspartate carbamoyltransferase regulatory subunit